MESRQEIPNSFLKLLGQLKSITQKFSTWAWIRHFSPSINQDVSIRALKIPTGKEKCYIAYQEQLIHYIQPTDNRSWLDILLPTSTNILRSLNTKVKPGLSGSVKKGKSRTSTYFPKYTRIHIHIAFSSQFSVQWADVRDSICIIYSLGRFCWKVFRAR